MREAWEALPLTRAEKQARKERYKDKRYIDRPLTGYEFAARVGATDRTVKRWAKTGVVGDEHAPRVSKALGMPLAEITRERRQDDLATLQSRLEGVVTAVVTTEELHRTVEPLTEVLAENELTLARHAEAIRFLANGKTREALRVLSDEGTP